MHATLWCAQPEAIAALLCCSWGAFFPLHTLTSDSNKASLASSRDHTEFVIFRKAFNCCFDFKMQMWGEGKKENRCPNIYIVSDIGEKKDQWESFNPENAKGLSLTCWWGFSGGSACCCVMFGWLP